MTYFFQVSHSHTDCEINHRSQLAKAKCVIKDEHGHINSVIGRGRFAFIHESDCSCCGTQCDVRLFTNRDEALRFANKLPSSSRCSGSCSGHLVLELEDLR